MFDVSCHLIQHIATGLSGPWCDLSPCKNGCAGAAWVAYTCIPSSTNLSKIPNRKVPSCTLIFPGFGVRVLNECSQVLVSFSFP